MIRYRRYRKKKPYVLAIVILLLAAFISFSALQGLFGVRSALSALIYPFQYAGLVVWKGVTGIPVSLANLRNLARENAKLKDELRDLKPRLLLLEGLRGENERLRAALALRQEKSRRLRLQAAQVIGRSPTPWFSILEIDQGGQDGIKPDLPVITEAGLAGRVIEVSRFSSKVMLLTDPESSVAAANEGRRDFGVVEGSYSNRLLMKYVGVGGEIKIGDKIVTSRLSTVFPPGILIGEVSHVSKGEHDLFYHIEIKPAVDFSKIEEVFIIF